MTRDMKVAERRVLADQMLKVLSPPGPIDVPTLLERTRKRTREGPAPDNATCLGCGYCVRGLFRDTGTSVYYGRCPECGRWFDPNDPSTIGPTAIPNQTKWLTTMLVVVSLAFILLALRVAYL